VRKPNQRASVKPRPVQSGCVPCVETVMRCTSTGNHKEGVPALPVLEHETDWSRAAKVSSNPRGDSARRESIRRACSITCDRVRWRFRLRMTSTVTRPETPTTRISPRVTATSAVKTRSAIPMRTSHPRTGELPETSSSAPPSPWPDCAGWLLAVSMSCAVYAPHLLIVARRPIVERACWGYL
jgi:hypothetical protein